MLFFKQNSSALNAITGRAHYSLCDTQLRALARRGLCKRSSWDRLARSQAMARVLKEEGVQDAFMEQAQCPRVARPRPAAAAACDLDSWPTRGPPTSIRRSNSHDDPDRHVSQPRVVSERGDPSVSLLQLDDGYVDRSRRSDIRVFQLELLGREPRIVRQHDRGDLERRADVNVPTGGLPLSIPSVTQSFKASPYDGTTNDAGTSGKQFPAVTSSSAVQTTVFTRPADLAAFTGNFRVPITVSGHANGSATSTNNDASSNFSTQTSVTITLVYHYTPNLPSLDAPANGSGSQSSGQSTAGGGGGTSAKPAPAGTTGSNSGSTGASNASVTHTTSKGKKHVVVQIKKPTPKHVAPAKHKVAKQPHKAGPR